MINSSGATVTETRLSQLSGITQGASYLESAALDTQRHVAYAEVYDSSRGVSELFTVDMSTGAVAGPIAINPNNTGRTFSNISVDESTGDVFATTTGTQGPCLDGAAYMIRSRRSRLGHLPCPFTDWQIRIHGLLRSPTVGDENSGRWFRP